MLAMHLATCGFALVPCPNHCMSETNAIKCIMRKDIDQHVADDCPNRSYVCEHCGKLGSQISRKEAHEKKCPKKQLICPNTHCTDTVAREDMERHIQMECRQTVIPCKFKNVGCDFKTKREAVAAHECDDKLHLHMSLEAVVKLQDENYQLWDKVNLLKKNTELMTTFKVSEYQRRLDHSHKYAYTFYSSCIGYHITVYIYISMVMTM